MPQPGPEPRGGSGPSVCAPGMTRDWAVEGCSAYTVVPRFYCLNYEGPREGKARPLESVVAEVRQHRSVTRRSGCSSVSKSATTTEWEYSAYPANLNLPNRGCGPHLRWRGRRAAVRRDPMPIYIKFDSQPSASLIFSILDVGGDSSAGSAHHSRGYRLHRRAGGHRDDRDAGARMARNFARPQHTER